MHIITFIASHIDSMKRLQNFLKLTETINGQIDYYDTIEIKVSVSHDESIKQNEIEFLLSHLVDNPNYQFFGKTIDCPNLSIISFM